MKSDYPDQMSANSLAKVRTNRKKLKLNKSAMIRISCAVMIVMVAAAVISASHAALTDKKTVSDTVFPSSQPSSPPQKDDVKAAGESDVIRAQSSADEALADDDIILPSEFIAAQEESENDAPLSADDVTSSAEDATPETEMSAVVPMLRVAEPEYALTADEEVSAADISEEPDETELAQKPNSVTEALPEEALMLAAAENPADVTAAELSELPEPDLIEEELAKVALAAIPEPEQTKVEEPLFTVVLKAYNQTDVTCTTPSTTVGALLESLDITPPANTGAIYLDLSQKITGDAEIVISSADTKIVEREEEIPFEITYLDVQTVPRGEEAAATVGVKGVKVYEYTRQYVNGEVISETFTREYVKTNPTNAVIHRGIGGTFQSPDGTAYTYSHYIDVQSTTYTGGGTTASGLPADESVISVDPKVIPLGTQVYVTGEYGDFGIRTAADVGGSVKGNKIDIYLNETNPLFANFGRRPMRVYFID